VVVVLQREREFVGVGLVGLAGNGGALDFDVVLNEDAIVKGSDAAEVH
jgi:hypothetical protein